ncbi:MAG: ABC transporter permease [Lachnospiraceae bacterium]|nr:ABC transporter permease [Lachnospiraceae bacterium]
MKSTPSADKKLMSRREYMRTYRKTSRLKEMWDVFVANRLAVAGLIIITIFLLLALFANVIADYDTVAIASNPVDRFQGPSWKHLLGTDEMGRDIFARIIHGARISLRIGVLSVLVGLVFSCIIGALAGYLGGIADDIIMRIIDIMACIPRIVMAIAIVAAFGSSEFNMIMALGIATIASMSRVVRSAVLSVRDTEYVEAAKAVGQSTPKIIFQHILVNCVAPIIVQSTLAIATNVMSVSSLSFLGMGIAAPAPEWGCMIASARGNMRQYPFLVIAPGMAIFLTSMAFNLVGDGLRDALDPKLKR